MDNFYLQLPSNGDPIYHPLNTLTEYTIHLPRRIELNGSWSVGLVELLYPHSFIQLSKTRSAKMKIVKNDYQRVYFPKLNLNAKNWIATFAAYLNNYLTQHFSKKKRGKSPVFIRGDEDEPVFTIMLEPGCEVFIEERLAFLLGYDGTESVYLTETEEPPNAPKNHIESTNEAWYMDIKCDVNVGYIEDLTLPEGFYLEPNRVVDVINQTISKSKAKDDVEFKYIELNKGMEIKISNDAVLLLNDAMGQLCGFGEKKTITSSIQAPHPVDIDIGFYNLFIYSSLIASDEIVGSSLTPLLRCVPVRGKHGDTISEIYQFPFYKRLVRNTFHEISIAIRDDTSEPIQFAGIGRVNVTLHFKRND